MKFPNIFIFLLFTSQGLSEGHKIKTVVRLINDLIRNEEIPAVLAAKTCYNQIDNIYFSKNSISPIEFIQGLSIPEKRPDDFTNKLWFFIDADCTDSLRFLEQVRFFFL